MRKILLILIIIGLFFFCWLIIKGAQETEKVLKSGNIQKEVPYANR